MSDSVREHHKPRGTFWQQGKGRALKKKLKGDSSLEVFELSGLGEAVNASLQFNLDPAVEFAEPNFLVKSDQISTAPNDSRFSEQWALSNVGQGGGQYGSDIDAGNAWQTTTGLPRTVVAIIDSGIDFTLNSWSGVWLHTSLSPGGGLLIMFHCGQTTPY
ncbi:MAG TPA: hypothetical protein VJT71_13765 [Pyrinomonadaceae bacterium]|nr:hypothetical protein [Pyrinomonadaceae bacterium]